MSVVIGELHRRALQYINNASGSLHGSVEIAWFDEDHDPIGPSLRGDLVRAGLIEEKYDRLMSMTDKGREELKNG